MALQRDKVQIAAIFRAMDINNDGTLSMQEVKDGYFECMGTSINDEQVKQIFKNVDMDKNGQLDYSEFMMAVIKEEEIVNQ